MLFSQVHIRPNLFWTSVNTSIRVGFRIRVRLWLGSWDLELEFQ